MFLVTFSDEDQEGMFYQGFSLFQSERTFYKAIGLFVIPFLEVDAEVKEMLEAKAIWTPGLSLVEQLKEYDVDLEIQKKDGTVLLDYQSVEEFLEKFAIEEMTADRSEILLRTMGDEFGFFPLSLCG